MQQHGDKRRGMRARLTTAATRQRPRWTADAAVALLYAAGALAFTYPLWINPGTHIAFKASGDQLWVLSLLEWMRTALFSRPDEFFVGNFYFGSGGAMFGSHLMLGFLPIYGPLAWVTQNPVLAYSLTHIAAYALNAGAMYAAVLVLTRSRPGALLAGAIYAFGPLQLAYSNHFQFLGAWWLPLVLLFGVRVWRGGGWLDFGLATLMVWVQFTTNAHLGLIAAMVFAAFVALPAVYRVASERNFRLGLGMVASGTLVTAPFIPIVQGYLSFSEAWRLDRDITEVQFWSVQLRDYLSPNGRLQWYGALTERFPVPRGEHRVFPGFVPPLLAAVGVGAGLVGQRATGKGLRIVTILLVMLAAAGVVFSLGTHWKRHEVVSDIALPYLQLFEHVPVFQGIRVVARFSLLAHFAIAVLAGIGVFAITRRLPRRWLAAPLVGLVATALVLVEAVPRPLSTFEIPTDPPLRAALRECEAGSHDFRSGLAKGRGVADLDDHRDRRRTNCQRIFRAHLEAVLVLQRRHSESDPQRRAEPGRRLAGLWDPGSRRRPWAGEQPRPRGMGDPRARSVGCRREASRATPAHHPGRSLESSRTSLDGSG